MIAETCAEEIVRFMKKNDTLRTAIDLADGQKSLKKFIAAIIKKEMLKDRSFLEEAAERMDIDVS